MVSIYSSGAYRNPPPLTPPVYVSGGDSRAERTVLEPIRHTSAAWEEHAQPSSLRCALWHVAWTEGAGHSTCRGHARPALSASPILVRSAPARASRRRQRWQGWQRWQRRQRRGQSVTRRPRALRVTRSADLIGRRRPRERSESGRLAAPGGDASRGMSPTSARDLERRGVRGGTRGVSLLRPRKRPRRKRPHPRTTKSLN